MPQNGLMTLQVRRCGSSADVEAMAELRRVWGEEQRGSAIDDESGDAQVFFEFDADGLISRVTDFWPEPYDPPERPAGLMERW